MNQIHDELNIQAGPITYQWQVSTDSGITFNNLSGAPNSPTLSLTNINAIQNNYYYRAVASSGGLTIISSPAKLTALPKIDITSQPTNQVSYNQSATFSFSVNISNGAQKYYQWESAPASSLSKFSPIVGATGVSLLLNDIDEQDDGSLYRAKIVAKFNDALPLTVYTNSAQLDYISLPINITQHPRDLYFSNTEEPELFSVTVSHNGDLSYQWQESADGINFVNLPFTNNPTLYVSAIEDILNKNQYKYRAVISSDEYSVFSNAGTLHTGIELPIIDTVYNSTYLWGDPHLRIQSIRGPIANIDDNKYKDPIVYFYIKYDNEDSYKAVYQNRFSSATSTSGPAAVSSVWVVKNSQEYTGTDPNSTQSIATPSTNLKLSSCTFAGVTGWNYFSGRCLSFSTTAGLSNLDNANYSQLIKNSVKWLCKNKSNPSIVLMSSGNGAQDLKFKNQLATLTNKAVNVIVLSSFDNSNNILDTTDVVVLQNNYNWNSQTLTDSAQTALKTFVTKGGGLLTTEWVIYNMAQGLLKILKDVVPVIPTSAYTTKSPIRYIKNINDSILNTGVSSDFIFLSQNIAGTETAIVEAKAGATIFYHSEQCVDNTGEKTIAIGDMLTLIYKPDTWNSNLYYNVYTKWNKTISYTGKVKIGGALYWILKSLIEYKKDPTNIKYAAWKSGLTGSNTDGYGLVMKPYGITRQMLTDAVSAIDGSSQINAITEEITIGDDFWKNLSKLLRGLRPDDKYYTKNVLYFIKNPGNRITTPNVSVSMDSQALSTSGSLVSYRWQVSSNGGISFGNISDSIYYSGTNSAILTLKKPLLADNGKIFRLSAMSNGASTKYSNTSTLSVVPSIIISTYPTEQKSINGTAVFSVSASSTDGTLKYQWQKSSYKNRGYSNISNAVLPTLSVSVTNYNQNNTYYRVVIKNNSDATTTNGVKLVAVPVISISQQPKDYATNTSTAVFSATASSTNPLNTVSTLTYQWQVSNNNKTYTNIVNQTNPILSLTNLTKANNNYYYRAVIRSSGVTQVISNPAQVKITPSILTGSISNIITYTTTLGVDYANSVMGISATSTGGNLTYQWQQSKDKGITYTNIAGATTNQLIVKNIPKNAYANYKYRVLITNPMETIIAY
jgi:hypothetical protein